MSARFQILAFIRQYIDTFGYAPTLAEIQRALGLQPHKVSRHIATLISWGYLRVTGYIRGYAVVRSDEYAVPLTEQDRQVLARVAAQGYASKRGL